jgi:hypothetical protein
LIKINFEDTSINSTHFIILHSREIIIADNTVVGVVGVAQDVTEEAKRDRAVASMATELRQLVDTANGMYF